MVYERKTREEQRHQIIKAKMDGGDVAGARSLWEQYYGDEIVDAVCEFTREQIQNERIDNAREHIMHDPDLQREIDEEAHECCQKEVEEAIDEAWQKYMNE
jgi:hypothetical protein